MRIIPAFIHVPEGGDYNHQGLITVLGEGLKHGVVVTLDETTDDRVSAVHVFDRQAFDALPVHTQPQSSNNQPE